MTGIYKILSNEKAELMTAPPCVDCKFWKPEKVYAHIDGKVGAQYSGHRYCWAENQYCDFSCFEKRETQNAS